MGKPQFYLREMLGAPYVRKVLGTDGETYIDAPPVVVPPDVLAARRAFAEPEIARAKAALMGKPITWRIQ
jgi:hypothetical protein